MATVLTIAGSDSCAGAGLQADLKTISALGGYACCAVAAITAQNTLGVRSAVGVAPEMLRAQIDTVFDDFEVDAVKTGMLFGTEQVRVVAECIEKYQPKIVVVDPVMISSSGHPLLSAEAVSLLREQIFPQTSILTPNLAEAEFLTETKIQSIDDMKKAAETLQKTSCKSVIIKGGHRSDTATDVLLDENGNFHTAENLLIESRNTHGTGCTFASAVATFLAQNENTETAFRNAKEYVFHAIETAKKQHLGHKNGPLNHFYKLNF